VDVVCVASWGDHHDVSGLVEIDDFVQRSCGNYVKFTKHNQRTKQHVNITFTTMANKGPL